MINSVKLTTPKLRELTTTMISILVLLFVLGVASPRHISYYDNATAVEPIMARSQERRICAELCMSGLGGAPCGEDCLDVGPAGMPTLPASQSGGGRRDNGILSRRDACPLLCASRLGYPLCKCDPNSAPYDPFFRVDYLGICTHFCTTYNYQIYGCDQCSVYKDKSGVQMLKAPTGTSTYDWDQWCDNMCHVGDGGAACNCDLLPMKGHL